MTTNANSLILANSNTYLYIGIAVFVLLLAALIAILVVASKRNSEKNKQRIAAEKAAGVYGEDKIAEILGNDVSGEKHVFRDYILDVDYDQSTTEMDFIVVTRSGVFVIEVKNWAGTIYTYTEKDKDWIQKYKGNKKTYYSPIRQNNAHVDALREIIPRKVPITSIIVFANENSKVRGHGKSAIIWPSELNMQIEKAPEVLTENGVETVANLLVEFQSTVTYEEHMENVRKFNERKKKAKSNSKNSKSNTKSKDKGKKKKNDDPDYE